MARLLVYDAYENKVYTYSSLRENDPMPYSTGRTLTVREFRGKSNSPVLWTTIAAMEAWNLTRRKYGRGIPVGYAFRRIWEGGHGTRSQHYAGVAFDVGQSLSQTQRTAIYNAARSTGAWGYVEPPPGQPGLLRHDPPGRPLDAGLPDREPHRRHLRQPDGRSSQGLPAAHQSARRRRLRLQQLEKDLHRRAGRGTNQDDY